MSPAGAWMMEDVLGLLSKCLQTPTVSFVLSPPFHVQQWSNRVVSADNPSPLP